MLRLVAWAEVVFGVVMAANAVIAGPHAFASGMMRGCLDGVRRRPSHSGRRLDDPQFQEE